MSRFPIFSLFFLLLLCLAATLPLPAVAFPSSSPFDHRRWYRLNCGYIDGDRIVTVGRLQYSTDANFTSVGNTASVNEEVLTPILSTVRYFPDKSARKNCYVFPVIKGGHYLIRTTYYYGGFDGGKEPPVFDQIVEGTKWSTVNTTEDYANGLSSYYEIVIGASTKTMSVCLARNDKTASNSNPFISALELEYLDGSVYNSTDFKKYALSTVARAAFGNENEVIGYPDDPFNRLIPQLKDPNHLVVKGHVNVTPSSFWNLPPAKIFNYGITASRGMPLELMWPPFPLPLANYYISLYFQDNRSPSPYSWRVFNVSINGRNFYSNLNVTTNGVNVYATDWPLEGQIQIFMVPATGMFVGPVINAAEVLQLLPLTGKTLPRDVLVLEELAKSLNNVPADWSGDPCLPVENSWTGVSCTPGKHTRIVALILTDIGLSGTLSPNISRLTALSHLWLSGNQISGSIPDMDSMKELQTLHLQDNKFEGKIPKSLGKLPKIREIYLQDNMLDSESAQELKNSNKRADIRV